MFYQDEEVEIIEGELNSINCKKWSVTAILCAILGIFGCHRFYTNHRLSGKIQLALGIFSIFALLFFPAAIFSSDAEIPIELAQFTFCIRILLIWVIIDFLLICCNFWKDKDGQKLSGYSATNGFLAICVFAVFLLVLGKVYNVKFLNISNDNKLDNNLTIQDDNSYDKFFTNKKETNNIPIVPKTTNKNEYQEPEKVPEKREVPSSYNQNKIIENKTVKVDFSDYMKRMTKKIKSNWNPPKGKTSKSIIVLFNIAHNGKLNSTKIFKTSGDDELDKSAINAIELSAPFEPLPDEYRKENIDVKFNFDYNVYGPNR